MSVPRPLPKELLKKMFLKVLYEHKNPESCYSACSSDFVSIICNSMAEFFGIPELNEEEYGDCLAAVYELERDGYISQDQVHQAKMYKDLTDKGKKAVEEKLLDLKLPNMEIDQYLTREDLRSTVLDDYFSGEYEASIYKAFLLLEEIIKSKGTSQSKMVDQTLMSKSYVSKEGKLRRATSEVQSELESLHRIMRGTLVWFRDPEQSKTFGVNDAEAAAQILVFANLHLNIIDQ